MLNRSAKVIVCVLIILLGFASGLIHRVLRKISRQILMSSPVETQLVDPYSAEIEFAKEKVLTIKAYIDEAERELFRKDWDNLFIYLNVITEQDEEFATLIDGLFPSQDPLDRITRESMAIEAQALYLALDELKEATKNKNFDLAQISYARLLLSYDRFLKAGNLYPTYDPITSTEIFFTDTPRSTLKFDTKSKIHPLDQVVFNDGPDMGKTGIVIYIDSDKKKAVVKLDKDGRAYQEVKIVKLEMLSKNK